MPTQEKNIFYADITVWKVSYSVSQTPDLWIQLVKSHTLHTFALLAPPVYMLLSYLGQGELALAFGDLLRKLWAPGATALPPRLFKSKLARFAPQFSGFSQHDSQVS